MLKLDLPVLMKKAKLDMNTHMRKNCISLCALDYRKRVHGFYQHQAALQLVGALGDYPYYSEPSQ